MTQCPASFHRQGTTSPSTAAASSSGSSAAAAKRKSDEDKDKEDVKSPYFAGSGSSSAKASPPKKRATAETAVDPSSFFNSNAKIHQSEKTVKPASAKVEAPKRKAEAAKKPSFAKADDDDEFADFDIDLSQIDESAFKAIDAKKYSPKIAVTPVSEKCPEKVVSAPRSPPKPKKATPIKAPSAVEIDVEEVVPSSVKKRSPAKTAIKAVEEPVVAKKPSPVKGHPTPAPVVGNPVPTSTAAPVPAPATAESSKKANYMKILAKKGTGGLGPSAPGSKDIPVGEDNCLQGLTFVFTGELSSISRDDAQDLVKRYGGRVTGGVSGKTSYVVVGEEAGQSKLAKATSLKIKTLDEDQLFDLVRNSKGKAEVVAKPASKAPTKKASATVTPASSFTAGNKPPVVTASSSFYGSSTSVDIKGKGKAPAYMSENIPPKKPSSDLWTTKYKPTKYDDVMGNKKNVERLATWLKGWDFHNATDKPASTEPGNSRAILISGPPGIGKTTAAHLVATLEGFEIVEFNASDTRSKKTVGDVVKEMTGSHTLAEYFVRDSDKRKNLARRQVLIMDEVDGMSAGDRGGITELINIIKKSKIPIICICNDRQSPKVKSLVNHCFDMRFMRPRTAELEKTIKNIAMKEGLDIKQNAMDTLVKSTQSDIRQILNMLSTYSLSSSELSFDQSRTLSKSSEKNMTMSPWDVTGTLLNRGSFRDASFADKLELYFSDFSLIPLMIQVEFVVGENYIKMDPSLAHENGGSTKTGRDMETMNCLSQAADAIAYGDIISSVQMKTQNWGLLPFQGVTSTLRPAFFTHGTLVNQQFYGGGGGGFAFPGWLGKNSNQGKNVRLLKEIQLHMRLHVSADKNEVRQSYLPAMAPLLTVPMAQREQDGIAQVIQTMDEYYLTREDWDSILDLGLEECSAKSLTSGIASTTKSAFTRTYNKTNHPKPFMSASLLGKVSRGGSGGGGTAPDLDDVVENDDEVVAAGDEEGQDEDEDGVGADRLIKQKVKKGGASSTAAASKKASGSGTAAKGKRAAESSAGKASSSKKQKK
ncbi:UNVERIFIED_CONTAM: hypothetical protein HDU68_007254 [Siphonaria sp. JEL0065]|nr:hypothetical protein HDU68_007254 [Siphonaria sp. JEL0065]